MRITLTAPVRHDGKALPAGTVMDIDEEGGARLVRLGVAEAAAESDGAPVAGKAEAAPLAAQSAAEAKSPDDDPGLNLPPTKKPQAMNKAELLAEINRLGLNAPAAKASNTDLAALIQAEYDRLEAEGDAEGGE